jgi:hypothetical protein
MAYQLIKNIPIEPMGFEGKIIPANLRLGGAIFVPPIKPWGSPLARQSAGWLNATPGFLMMGRAG